jgi:hypothetical protein
MKILASAIEVPLFFETDPIQTYGPNSLRAYHYELPYWQSERTRNSLRRVCRAWNTFLKEFDHRFVRLFDVFHGRVSVKAIPMAIRLDTSIDHKCYCHSHCRERLTNPSPGIKDKMEGLLRHAALTTKDSDIWRLKILYSSVIHVPELFTLIQNRAPNLASILGWTLPIYYATMGHLPSRLFTLTTTLQAIPSLPAYKSTISLSNLTTWHLHLSQLELPYAQWELPALRYLNIDVESIIPVANPFRALENILELVGRNLLTLFIVHPRISADIPDRVWALVPKLEQAQLPCFWTSGPPQSHPLQIIRLSPLTLYEHENGQVFFDDPRNTANIFLPLMRGSSWTFMRKFQVMSPLKWNDVLFRRRRTCISSTLWLAEYYESFNVRFVDAEGLTLNEYLVFLIKVFWKDGKGDRHFPYKGFSPPLF